MKKRESVSDQISTLMRANGNLYCVLATLELDYRYWDFAGDIRTRVRAVVESTIYWTEKMMVVDDLAAGKFYDTEGVLRVLR